MDAYLDIYVLTELLCIQRQLIVRAHDHWDLSLRGDDQFPQPPR